MANTTEILRQAQDDKPEEDSAGDSRRYTGGRLGWQWNSL